MSAEPIRIRAVLAATGVAVAALSLCACAAVPQYGEPAPRSGIESGITASAAAGAAPRASASIRTRRASTAAHTAILVARSAYIEPILRPFSTQKALLALILKSTFGFVRRVALDTVQFSHLEREPLPPLYAGPGMDLAQWESELDTIAGTATRGTVRFLVDGEEFFSRFIEAIRAAEDSIDVRTYIFDNDDFAVEVADLLKERAADVDTRVLLDGIGALLGTQVDPEGMPDDFRPPISMSSYLRNNSRVKVRTSGNPWLTGDHTKSTIVDGKVAFLGGMNIGREYRYIWHDLMVEVSGPVVDILQQDTDIAWSKAGWLGDLAMFFRSIQAPRERADDVGGPLRVLVTRDHDSQIYRAQLAAIRRAKRYIFIENSYFSDDATLYELAKARRRGVDVRVILPANGNHAPLNLSNAVAVNVMLRNGIRVYHFPGMTHVKAAIIDGWACVGSANFDKLSLQINEELNIATSDPATVDDLMQRVFIADFAVSAELEEPVPLRWSNHLAEFVSDEIF